MLLHGLIDTCAKRFDVTERAIRVTDENVVFKLPRVLADGVV